MTNFEEEDLSGSRFERVRLAGSRFSRVELTDAVFWETDLRRSTFSGVSLEEATISGDIDGLTINGIPVAPIVAAELDRLYPEHALLRPSDAEGFRVAFDALQEAWRPTIERARGLGPEVVTASVDGEWSFVKTLRHLSFATTSWLDRAILGDPSPWQPLDLPWDQMPPHPDVPWDRDADVSLDEALALRRASADRLRAYLGDLTDDRLAEPAALSANPNWPDERASVAECLGVVLNEEFWHHRFAVRDLDRLTDTAE